MDAGAPLRRHRPRRRCRLPAGRTRSRVPAAWPPLTSSGTPRQEKSVELDVQEQAEEVVEQPTALAEASPSVLPATEADLVIGLGNEALQREEGKWETALQSSKRMRASGLHEPQVTVNYLAREAGQLAAALP